MKKSSTMVVKLCVCVNRPSVWAVCPNHEVVVFQPRTVTATYSGSVYIVLKNYSNSSRPAYINRFWIFLFPPPPTAPPHHKPLVVVTFLCSTRSPPPLLERNAVHLEFSHTRHPPASAAYICAQSRVPMYATISRIC